MFERSEFEKFSCFNCFLRAWTALFCELFWCQKSGEGVDIVFFFATFYLMINIKGE